MGANEHGGAPNEPGGQPAPEGEHPSTHTFQHDPVSARVPERVGRGVFVTGVIVQEGSGEFVLDFVQSLTRPPQIAARVIVSPPVMQALVTTFAENIQKYTSSFGAPPSLPKPQPPPRPPTTQELYENFKLPDELLSGVYANSVLIGHQPAEFFLDFITRFYPTAAVSSRIYLAAGQAPRVQETLQGSFQQYLRRMGGPQQPQPPAPGDGG
jgi:hypothetical protein